MNEGLINDLCQGIGCDMKQYQFDNHCHHCSRPFVLYQNGYTIIFGGNQINNLLD